MKLTQYFFFFLIWVTFYVTILESPAFTYETFNMYYKFYVDKQHAENVHSMRKKPLYQKMSLFRISHRKANAEQHGFPTVKFY